MNEDMQRLTEKLDRQRADLAATNLAIAAIASAMTVEQRDHVLTAMAKASAEKQATFEQISTPAMREGTALFQEAEQRLFQMLQGAMTRYSKR